MLQQQAIIDKRTRPKFVQGRLMYDTTDVVSESDYFVTSEPILGGQHFYLRVKSGYKMAYVCFFDRETRQRITNMWFNPSLSSLEGNDGVYGLDNIDNCKTDSRLPTWIPAEAFVRVCVCRDTVLPNSGNPTGDTMTVADDFLDAFYTFDNVFLQHDAIGNVPPTVYATAMLLAHQVNAVYQQARTATKTQTGDWHSEGNDMRYCIGVPYSAVNSQRRGSMNLFMPSMESFLSLYGNRRSLLYTETPKSGVSEYGIDWKHDTSPVSSYGNFAYGMVCNCAAATVFGMPESTDEVVWSQTKFFEQTYASLSAMLSDNASNMRPLDVFYYNANHVFVVTNVYRTGGKVFIELFESSANCILRLMTPQKLYNYYTAKYGSVYKVVRPKSAFYRMVGRYNYRPTAGAPSTPRERSHYVPNDDICTFAGNKASFCAGDPIWLNVRQTNGRTNATFDSIRLYRKVGSSYELVTSFGTDGTLTMSTPASGHRKTFSGDGTNDVVWDIEVTSAFSAGTLTGLFRATAYNSTTEVESEPCEFEVLSLGIVGAWHIQYSHSVIAKLADGVQQQYSDRVPFIGTSKSDYTTIRNNYLSYRHYLVGQDEEGLYGAVMVESSTDVSHFHLYAKGEYGYAYKTANINGTSLTNLWNAASASTESGKLIKSDGDLLARSGWNTRIIPISSSHQGKTYHIVWNDTVQPDTYSMRVVQYDSNGDVITGKNQIFRGTSAAPSGATRLFAVEIDSTCATLKVSTVVDDFSINVVNNIVALPFTLDLLGGTESMQIGPEIEF